MGAGLRRGIVAAGSRMHRTTPGVRQHPPHGRTRRAPPRPTCWARRWWRRTTEASRSEIRLDAEQRLKRGELKVLGGHGVARTRPGHRRRRPGPANSARRVRSRHLPATCRPRSGHAVGGTPKARLFPQTQATNWSNAPPCSTAVDGAANSTRCASACPPRSTCWRSRSWPKPRATTGTKDALYALVRRGLAICRSHARALRRGRLRMLAEGLHDPRNGPRGAPRAPRRRCSTSLREPPRARASRR